MLSGSPRTIPCRKEYRNSTHSPYEHSGDVRASLVPGLTQTALEEAIAFSHTQSHSKSPPYPQLAQIKINGILMQDLSQQLDLKTGILEIENNGPFFLLLQITGHWLISACYPTVYSQTQIGHHSRNSLDLFRIFTSFVNYQHFQKFLTDVSQQSTISGKEQINLHVFISRKS